MRAPLVSGDGVDLVDDHRPDTTEHRAAALRCHQEIERLRRRDEEMRRPLQHRCSFRSGGVPRPNGYLDVRGCHSQLRGDLSDLPERRLEVLVDVDRQGLQRRHVHDLRPRRETDVCLFGSVQPVDTDQERRERLP